MLGLNTDGDFKATVRSQFGPVGINFAMDDVQCVGSESSLDDCPHKKQHKCGSHEGAGVVCSNTISLSGGATEWEGSVMFYGQPVW